jgi:hypothetical protein
MGDSEIILEGFASGFSTGFQGAGGQRVGGAAPGVGFDPELLDALAGLVRKLKRKRLRRQQRLTRITSTDRLTDIVNAILAVKAIPRVQAGLEA